MGSSICLLGHNRIVFGVQGYFTARPFVLNLIKLVPITNLINKVRDIGLSYLWCGCCLRAYLIFNWTAAPLNDDWDLVRMRYNCLSIWLGCLNFKRSILINLICFRLLFWDELRSDRLGRYSLFIYHREIWCCLRLEILFWAMSWFCSC